MDTNSNIMDTKYYSHDEFVADYNNNEIDFKIVGFCHDKLLFGSEKKIQKVLFYLQYLPLVVIPILSYVMNNWWLLFGLLIYYITVGFADRKIVPFVGIFTLYCIVFWFVKGFSFYQNTTIFYFCALYTNTIIETDRNLQRKWAKQNVLYLKDLYHKLVLKDNIGITSVASKIVKVL